MKHSQNKSLRVALILGILVIFCATLVGGTLAKYVISVNSIDIVRMAKWGVNIKVADGSNFDTQYESDDGSGTIVVKSSTEDRVVAPGTSGGDGLTFAITGSPEVATKIDVIMTVNSDIHLDHSYYPIVFTLTQVRDANGRLASPALIAQGNLASIKAALDEFTSQAYYKSNTVLDAEFALTWEWKHEDSNDAKDTLLGSLANGIYSDSYTSSRENWSTVLDYEIVFTVTQTDD